LIGLAVIGASASTTGVSISGACIIAAGGLAGFLILNYPPARIFMGMEVHFSLAGCWRERQFLCRGRAKGFLSRHPCY
jgi:UDP-N-acetylmuramyl pentapeptide phosphotransferase/UDP-N-acetylglucosamine-1-phosphate transferase